MSKSLLIITLLATTVSLLILYQTWTPSQTQPSLRTQDAFKQWKAKFRKNYLLAEESYRYSIFAENVRKIVDHNERAKKGEFTFVLDVNEFADLTQEEFKNKYLGYKKISSKNSSYLVNAVPSSVDWRTQNKVSPVKNQGSCGSCWAFSAIGALESVNAIKNGNLVQFSEQQLVDCSQKQGNEGCNGGLMDSAFQYVVENGIETEADYPYEGSDNTCAAVASKSAFKIRGFSDVPQNSSAQLKAALALNPVSVAIEADGFWFQFYFGGIFNSSCGTDLDHGVLAVGYGSENGQNYWIVKNSWGGSWGESGYIRIADNGDGPGLCGILLDASYPTV
jgi:C1A family cysteine protease